MPKREPGFSEPSLADEPRIFDGGEDDSDAEGSRLPLLLVIALIMVFAFGGVVWLAYKQGEATGRSSAPQIIAAEPGPTRMAPANPGGQTPYQGLKVYQEPAPTSDEADSATAEAAPALRRTEAPVAPVKQAPVEPPAAPTHAAEAVPTRAAAQTDAEPEASAPPAQLIAPKPAERAAVVKSADSKPVASKPVEKTKTLAAAPTQKPAAPTKAALAPAAEAAGPWRLQIGAYKSEDEAQKAWQIYSHRYPAVTRYTPHYERVDLGSKGVWYRLHIGAFDTRDAATAACDLLKAAGAACFPARG